MERMWKVEHELANGTFLLVVAIQIFSTKLVILVFFKSIVNENIVVSYRIVKFSHCCCGG